MDTREYAVPVSSHRPIASYREENQLGPDCKLDYWLNEDSVQTALCQELRVENGRR